MKIIKLELKYTTDDGIDDPAGAYDWRDATLTKDGWIWSNGNHLTPEELFINETAIREAMEATK